MSGKVALIVGARGQGKSTFNKERLKGFPRDRLHIHDIQREYFPNEPLIPVRQFVEDVNFKRDCFILFEEATIFFPNRGYDKGMVELLVSARHRGCHIHLVYHSLRAIPEYIYDLVDFVVLFNTKDKPHNVEHKFEDIYPHFMYLREHPEKCLQLRLYNGKVSPYTIIQL
jgi:hypothetical protein